MSTVIGFWPRLSFRGIAQLAPSDIFSDDLLANFSSVVDVAENTGHDLLAKRGLHPLQLEQHLVKLHFSQFFDFFCGHD